MNIKNLFLLLLLLVGFAACSSDNDEIDEKEGPVLVLDLKALGGVTTKADNNTTFPGEKVIDTYSVLIFNTNGSALRNKLSGGSLTRLEVTGLSEGEVVNIVAFVNMSAETKKAVDACGSLDDLSKVLETIANQTESQLTMATTSAVRREVTTGTNNVQLNLVRLASRVQVSSISTNFKIANDYSVTVNSLKLLQVKTSSYLYGSGAIEVDESEQQERAMFNAPKEGAGWNVSNTQKLTIITDGSALKNEMEVAMPYAYAFENTNSDAPTQLLLNATLWDNKGNEVATRNFKVTVHEKVVGNEGHTYLKRNYIYDLGLSFEDTSFDMGALVVKVAIVPWGSVKQETEVD
ncbi:fimbrial protein [Parabacteroides sp.]